MDEVRSEGTEGFVEGIRLEMIKPQTYTEYISHTPDLTSVGIRVAT